MGKYKIKQKGYEVDFNKIQEGYLASEVVCHAINVNKARYALFGKIGWDGWKVFGGDEVTYCNIPIKRCKEADLIEFEGSDMPLYKVEEMLAKRAKFAELDAILNDESIQYCYIYKGSYYRPNSCGYTDSKSRAGVYTKEEAVSDAKSVTNMRAIPINIVDHNTMIAKEIKELSTRLIC